MTTIVYMIRVDGIPRYVGSSQLGATYVRRQKNHRQTKAWLKNVELSRVSFDIIEECEDDKRYELEHFYWSILMTEGFQLENKRDPINAWPLTDRKEAAAIGVETKRRNGTIGNGGRAPNGAFRHLTKGSYLKGIETKRKNGTAGNGGKTSGRLNLPKMVAAGNSEESRAKAKLTRIKNSNLNKTGQANKGQKRTKISEMNVIRHLETVEIMKSLGIDNKKIAAKIRMIVKYQRLSHEEAYLVYLCTC